MRVLFLTKIFIWLREAEEQSRDHKIILICLPPHCSHWLQPADRTLFRSLKHYWSVEVAKALQSNVQLSRYSFGAIFNKAWLSAATMKNSISGFECCGIYPFNPKVLSDNVFALTSSNEKTSENVSHPDVTQLEQTPPDLPPCKPSTSKIDLADANTSVFESKRADSIALNDDLIRKLNFSQIHPSPKLQRKTKLIARCKLFGSRELTSPENIKYQTEKEKAIKVHGQNLAHTNGQTRKKMQPVYSMKSDCAQDDPHNYCSVCKAYFYDDMNGADWIQCTVCTLWQHMRCTGNPKNLFGYECAKCEDSD